MSLLVKEIYHTLQGEGPSAGLTATFVRLSGCSLRCRYCDSEYAFTGGEKMPIKDVLSKVKFFKNELVVVTGGEPLDQKETPRLLETILEEGYRVELETAGHKSIQDVPGQVKILLDVKTPGSGMKHHHQWDNLENLKEKDVLKFVITDREDYLWFRDEIATHWQNSLAEPWLSPASPVNPDNVSYKIRHKGLDPERLASWILEDGLPVRFQLQLHRSLWPQENSR